MEANPKDEDPEEEVTYFWIEATKVLSYPQLYICMWQTGTITKVFKTELKFEHSPQKTRQNSKPNQVDRIKHKPPCSVEDPALSHIICTKPRRNSKITQHEETRKMWPTFKRQENQKNNPRMTWRLALSDKNIKAATILCFIR